MTNFNQLSPAESERLALLVEECGEVIQICGKILRHGYESYHPENPDGPTNRLMLTREIGDVVAACELMFYADDVSANEVMKFSGVKLENVGKYLHHQNKGIKNE